ncbi:MAG: hypothetical protein ACPG4N_06345 [Gammaproteobacteria bacterium]
MISLQRERTEAAINRKYRGQRKIDREFTLLKAYRDSNADPEFSSAWWRTSKDQLKIEAHNKCAYCEADVSVVAHGDVEHYRPKSSYWWLAYCYDNYLYSCQICNQTFKGKHFPIHGNEMPSADLPNPATDQALRQLAGALAPDPLDEEPRYTLQEYSRLATREKAGLPNPYMEDPETLFIWEADSVNRQVSIAPRHRRRVRPKRAFAAAESYLGLNREQLRTARWRIYRPLPLFKAMLLHFRELGDPMADKIEEELRLMMADDAPFAAMVRYFVREKWALLP